MRATHPVCYQENGWWICELRDHKTDRVWSKGYGDDRITAIKNARETQPKEAFIKRAIGWIRNHPVKAGLAIGAYMVFRRPIKQMADWCCRFTSQVFFSLGVPKKACDFVNKAAKMLP